MNEKILRRGGTYCIQVTVHGARHESILFGQRPTKSQRQSFRRKYDRSYSRDSTWDKTAYMASINAHEATAEDKRAAEPTIAAVKALIEVERRQHQARRLATSAKRSESPPASASEQAKEA
uniref:Uncharacterized protein n=1 Tax=Haptolina ericina TaxID=156174 RepID=A0A7S3EQ58_9EUKA